MEQSGAEFESLTGPRAAGDTPDQQLKEEMVLQNQAEAPKTSPPPRPSPSVYELLLGTSRASGRFSTTQSREGTEDAKLLRPAPLELLLARFFSGPAGFYELDVLNKSVVKSYVVALGSQVYSKAVSYIESVLREMLTAPGEGQAEQAPSLKPDSAAATRKEPSLLTREQVLLPTRWTALSEEPTRVFDNYLTVPISLKAVPSGVQVPAQHLPGALGLGEHQPHGKQGKKSRGQKHHQKAPAASSAVESGFVLEPVSWRRLSNLPEYPHLQLPRSRTVAVSSQLFSMPLGAAFTCDPLVLQGESVTQLSDLDVDHGPVPWHLRRRPQDKLAMYRDEPLLAEQEGEAGWSSVLEKAQDAHRKQSEALIDAFIEQIQRSFAASIPKAESAQPHPATDSDAAPSTRHQEILVKSFVGLAMRASVHSSCHRTLSDMELVSKVLKLVQSLLRQELVAFEQRKIEVLRLSAISPLIHFIIQTISMSILGDQSTIPLSGYKFLPGLVNVIALLKQTFKVYEFAKDQKGQHQAGAGPNLLDCLQAFTSEGIDFARERVFETPHPYPQNDYSQSETIEVPKALGFIVELDRRCSAEHSTDQLVMYSGSDHIFQINPNFATQVKFSTKPSVRQPYLLLGSRMKVDFRSYSHRQRRRGGGGGGAAYLHPTGGDSGSRRSG